VHCAANAVDAAALLDRPPQRVSRRIELPSTVQAPALARLLLADACADWDLDEALRQRAVQVVNELVTNAVEHSVGRHTLRLVLDARGLSVAVDDGTPADPDLRARARLGLAVVEELSDAWGVAPSRRGKSVWALLRHTRGADR
jgi:anti-sigma regulatory factor (Ser/Thr protein kinase)